jgi:hypothetical protein
MVYVGFKVLRLAFSYAALMIAKNFTAQIYMEKVLVNGENPPQLSNLIFLSLVIEAVMSMIFMALLYAVDAQFELNLANDETNIFTEFILPDYIISVIMTFAYGSVVASKMYQKKYFLYKDDGLRAIRALSEMMFSMTVINAIVPWNFLVKGLLETVVKMYK